MKRMIDVNGCSGRPGIVKVMNEGKLETLAFRNKEQTRPEVCKCECEAGDLMASFGLALLKAGLDSAMRGKGLPDVPDVENFFYVYVDEEPAELDADASAFAGVATDVINHVK